MGETLRSCSHKHPFITEDYLARILYTSSVRVREREKKLRFEKYFDVKEFLLWCDNEHFFSLSLRVGCNVWILNEKNFNCADCASYSSRLSLSLHFLKRAWYKMEDFLDFFCRCCCFFLIQNSDFSFWEENCDIFVWGNFRARKNRIEKEEKEIKNSQGVPHRWHEFEIKDKKLSINSK